MPQATDRWGLDLTIAEAPAADTGFADRTATGLEAASMSAIQEELVTAYVTFSPDLPSKLGAALADPLVPLARLTAAYLLLQAHTTADHRRAADLADSLTRQAASDAEALNDRERAHLAVLRLLIDGRTDAAADALDVLLARWPTDMLALRLSHFVLFNRGRLADMVRSVTRSIAAWDDRPFRSYLDGMHAFALEELGEYRQAERLGRGAVEVDRTDLWSVHSVAHVLEMEARTEEGLTWFEGRDDDLVGAFARHLWWHRAIIHLRTGDHARLLELYDTRIQPGPALDGLSLTNAIDGLARLEFAGVDVGDRWLALVDAARHRIGYHDHPFNDSHFAYALARAGAQESAADLLAGMADWCDRPTTAAGVLTRVGLDTARAMAALGRDDRDTAVLLLERGREDRWQLGGSHAQRRLFELAEDFARKG